MTTTNPFELYFLHLFKYKFAQFAGRARRKEYWYFVLFNFIFTLGLGAVDNALDLDFLAALYAIIAFVPALAVSVRRLHDTGKSGLWLLVAIIPFIGWIILIYFTLQESEPHDNQYGPNPKRLGVY